MKNYIFNIPVSKGNTLFDWIKEQNDKISGLPETTAKLINLRLKCTYMV